MSFVTEDFVVAAPSSEHRWFFNNRYGASRRLHCLEQTAARISPCGSYHYSDKSKALLSGMPPDDVLEAGLPFCKACIYITWQRRFRRLSAYPTETL